MLGRRQIGKARPFAEIAKHPGSGADGPLSVIGSATPTAQAAVSAHSLRHQIAEKRHQLTAVPGGAYRPGRSAQETVP